jgi:hypothetical protein
MKIKIFTCAALLSIYCNPAFSQTETITDPKDKPKTDFKVTADIVSSYIWRGTVANLNPNIQPTLAIVSGGFEAGVWGSTDYHASYREVDPYLTYTLKTFKIGITDYNWTFANHSYFDYDNSTTDHIIEATLGFTGTEKLPLSITINTMIYGADKKWDFESGQFSAKQNYSTYIELFYSFGHSGVFVGATPANGYYGAGYGKIKGFALCNLGLTSSKNIKISEEFELPLKGTLYVNPQAESIHFVIGITF